MELYVGPLPQDINQFRIKFFFKGFEKHIQIDIRHFRHEHLITTFAFITVNSDRIGRKLITNFDGKFFNSVPVEVREYIHRCSGNERRAITWRSEPWRFFERRKNLRRKFRQVMEMEDAWFTQTQQKSTRG